MRNSYFDDEFALSNSIQHRESGRMLPTLVQPASREELSNLPGIWLFDWIMETSKYRVYKLLTSEKPEVIQGLISFQQRQGYYFVSLAESAPFNRDAPKLHEGVGGNLFAFVCKLSVEKGYGGFVSFESKTELKNYYQNSFGAKSIGNSNNMYIDEQAAERLIKIYFQ